MKIQKNSSETGEIVSKLNEILVVLKQIREDHRPLTRQDILNPINGDHSDSSR